MMDASEYDTEIVEKLTRYFDRTVTEECQDHIEAVYLFGSFARARANPDSESAADKVWNDSDVDVFFVMDEWAHPGTVDVTTACMANVPEAVERGVGRQRGDRWTGRDAWEKGPEAVLDEVPQYLVDSLRNIIGEPFQTSRAQRWVDVFAGSEAQLSWYGEPVEQIPFPE